MQWQLVGPRGNRSDQPLLRGETGNIWETPWALLKTHPRPAAQFATASCAVPRQKAKYTHDSFWSSKSQKTVSGTLTIDFREIFRNSGKNLAKFRKNLAKSRKNSKNCEKNDENFAIVWRKNWDSKTVQRSALCRSRRELSNAYLLAKFGFDTAENEPPKVWGGRVLSARHSTCSTSSWWEGTRLRLRLLG